MDFEPVTIADLIAEGAELTAHCRKCGYHKAIDPNLLTENLHARPVPSLEGIFKCSWCGSRQTCAMPLYRSQKSSRQPTGEGWIVPPAE